MIQPYEAFSGSFPFEPHFTDSPGFRMHYVDKGPRDGEVVVLCLHDEPAWGYLFRHLIPSVKYRPTCDCSRSHGVRMDVVATIA